MNPTPVAIPETPALYFARHLEAWKKTEEVYQAGYERRFNVLVKDVEELAFPGAADQFLAEYTQPDTTWSELYQALEVWAKDECLISACSACSPLDRPGNGLYQGDCPVCGGRGYMLTGGVA